MNCIKVEDANHIQTPHSEAAIGLFTHKPLYLFGLITVERQQKHRTVLGLGYLSYIARNGLSYKSRVYKTYTSNTKT